MAQRVDHRGRVTLLKRKRERSSSRAKRARPALSPLPPLPSLRSVRVGRGLGKGGREGGRGSLPLEGDWSHLPPQDPLKVNSKIRAEILPEIRDQDDFVRVWDHLRTKYTRRPLSNTYQFRIPAAESHTLADIKEFVLLSYNHFNRPCKLTVQASYVLYNRRTDEHKFYYQSENTVILQGIEGRLMRKVKDVEILLEHLDIEEVEQSLQFGNMDADYMWSFLGFGSVLIRCMSVVPKHVFGCDLPDWLADGGARNICKGGLRCFVKKSNARPWKHPNLCMFRALHYLTHKTFIDEMSRHDLDREVERGSIEMAIQYASMMELPTFDEPITTDDFDDIERIFKLRLNIWRVELSQKELKFERTKKRMKIVKKSRRTIAFRFRVPGPNVQGREMSIALIGNHATAIIDENLFAHVFFCPICDRRFATASAVDKHSKQTDGLCDTAVVRPTNRCWYAVKPTLAAELTAWGIDLPADFETFNLFGGYDCETYQRAYDTPPDLQKGHLHYLAELRLISMAFGTNIPGMEPMVYVETEDWHLLVIRFLHYVERASVVGYKVYKQHFASIFKQIRRKRRHIRKGGTYGYNPWPRLLQDLKTRFKRIKFFGWYSSAFDVPVILSIIAEQLRNRDALIDDDRFKSKLDLLKKGCKYLNVSWLKGCLRDFSLYLAPGTSLAAFMQTYKIKNGKLSWPHGAFTSPQYLDRTEFPPHEAFYNDLKDAMTLSVEDYNVSKKFYIDSGCKDMAEYLALYNLRDVVPFLDAMEQHVALVYDHFQINLLEEGMTLPAVSHRLMMKNMSPVLPFYLPIVAGSRQITVQHSQQHPDVKLHQDIRDGSFGGLSVVLERVQAQGLTRIPKSTHLTDKIIGVDFNSLYSYCMAQGQFVLHPNLWEPGPTGRFSCTSFKPSTLSTAEMEMVLYLMNTDPWKNQLLRSSMHWNQQLKPLINRGYRADFAAINSREIFELDG